MATKHHTTPKSSRSEESNKKISEHKKSTNVSSSKIKKQADRDANKNIEKTGGKHDDWNDPTGNSHVSSADK